MTIALVQKAQEAAKASIRELKRLDRKLTTLGCLNAHVHYKRRALPDGTKQSTQMMYMLARQDPKTKRRKYIYVGVSEEKQRQATGKIARYHLRVRLRERIVQLKSALRRADSQLSATLQIYRALAAEANATVQQFSPQAR